MITLVDANTIIAQEVSTTSQLALGLFKEGFGISALRVVYDPSHPGIIHNDLANPEAGEFPLAFEGGFSADGEMKARDTVIIGSEIFEGDVQRFSARPSVQRLSSDEFRSLVITDLTLGCALIDAPLTVQEKTVIKDVTAEYLLRQSWGDARFNAYQDPYNVQTSVRSTLLGLANPILFCNL